MFCGRQYLLDSDDRDPIRGLQPRSAQLGRQPTGGAATRTRGFIRSRGPPRPPPAPSAEERAAAARAAAEKELAEMKESGRYQLDLWALDHGFDDDRAAADDGPQ